MLFRVKYIQKENSDKNEKEEGLINVILFQKLFH